MAEALTNLYLREAGMERSWFATSAGIAVWHRIPAAEGAVEALKEYGLDISGHRSRSIDEISLQDVALILGMTKEHADFLHDRYPEKKGAIFRFSDYLVSGIQSPGNGFSSFSGDVPDPFGLDPAAYRDVARTLAMYAKELVKRLESRS
jgi:protein-tyrosine-phosphatase